MATRTDQLLEELVGAHDDFVSTLARVPPDRLRRPALVGEWSAQELIAHLGYWAGYAVEVIHAAERGGMGDFGEGRPSVEEINATVARIARQSDLAAVRAREQASFETLATRVANMDPALLDTTLPSGATVEREIREDGAEHYRQHAAELAALIAR